MDDWFSKFFSWQLAAWSALLLNVVAVLKIRNERKRDLSVERAGDWERIRNERDLACAARDQWHAKYIASEAEKVELMKQVAELRGTLQGFGEWRQMQAIREAGKRLTGATEPQGDGK